LNTVALMAIWDRFDRVYSDLVGRERLELSTNGLRVHCSTN
jgi:hypothetical protein